VSEDYKYKKSFEDELDWNLLGQIHKVVLQISSFCFRTKQICLTVDIAAIGILIKFTENKLDASIFITALLIPTIFWFLDSMSYFYQVKLRGFMDSIIDRLKERNAENLILDSTQCVIAKERVAKPTKMRVLNSFFNHSMWIYYFLIATDIVLWIMWKVGVISS